MRKLLKRLFQSWREVLITQNMEQFMKIKAQLNDNGIVTKTKIRDSNSNMGRGRIRESNSRSMYYLLVKSEDFGKAKVFMNSIKK